MSRGNSERVPRQVGDGGGVGWGMGVGWGGVKGTGPESGKCLRCLPNRALCLKGSRLKQKCSTG